MVVDRISLGLAPDAGDELATMLVDSARRFLSERHSTQRIRAMRADAAGIDRALWQEMADLGWLGICVPEAQGGSGLNPAHAAHLARILGGALLCEPFVQAGLLPTVLLAKFPEAEAMLTDAISGARLFTFAWQERAGELESEASETLVTGASANALVSGVKRFVPWATAADVLLVTASLDGELALVAIDRAAAHVSGTTQVDGAPSGEVRLAKARGHLLGTGRMVEQACARGLLLARLGVAAELVGLSSAVLGITAEYLRTRVQFGKPIGAFQALQHRLVDHYNQVRLADASVSAAARALAATPDAAEVAVSGAKARASEVAELVTAGAIQLHGAIGYTDEHDIGLYLKGALRRGATLGNAKAHRTRAIAALRPIAGAA